MPESRHRGGLPELATLYRSIVVFPLYQRLPVMVFLWALEIISVFEPKYLVLRLQINRKPLGGIEEASG